MEDTHHKIYARVIEQQGRNWYNAVIGVDEYSELFSNMLIWPELFDGQTKEGYPGIQRNDILIKSSAWKNVMNLVRHFKRENKSLSSTNNPLRNSQATGLLPYPIITYIKDEELTLRLSETDFKENYNAKPKEDTMMIVSLEGEMFSPLDMVEIYIPRKCKFNKDHISNPPQFKNPNLSDKGKGVDNKTFLRTTNAKISETGYDGNEELHQIADGGIKDHRDKTIHLSAKKLETDQPVLFNGGNSTVLEILDGFTRSTAIKVAKLKSIEGDENKALQLNEIPLVIQEPEGIWE